MSLVVITAPNSEPLTTAEAKAHLRVDHSDDDAYIDALIKAARVYVESYLQRALITTEFRLNLDGFPASAIELHPSLQAVSTLKYTDPDGVVQTWDSVNYVVDTDSVVGRLVPGYGLSWPSTRDMINAVQVTFTAGYGDNAADVPEPIRHAMRLLIGHLYENREAVNVGNIVSEMPFAIKALLDPHCVYGF